jgi:hypothetical protein
MGRNGHDYVMEHFSWDIEKVELLEFYRHLNAGRN